MTEPHSCGFHCVSAGSFPSFPVFVYLELHLGISSSDIMNSPFKKALQFGSPHLTRCFFLILISWLHLRSTETKYRYWLSLLLQKITLAADWLWTPPPPCKGTKPKQNTEKTSPKWNDQDKNPNKHKQTKQQQLYPPAPCCSTYPGHSEWLLLDILVPCH